MNYKEQAAHIIELIRKSQGSKKPHPVDFASAGVCVDLIIEAIQTTTGHCTLRKLDAQEVGHDIKYWKKVKNEILKQTPWANK